MPIPDITLSDVAQILILYLVIYSILKAAKGSRVGQVLTGVGIIATAMVVFTFLFKFNVLSHIVQALLVYLAISTVVIFQPEIRRVLGQVGAFGYLERPKHTADGAATPALVVDAILSLSDRRIGALIAFERGISLSGYESTGVATDAIFTRELVRCIFTPPMPLHDGGVTVRHGRISAAHCVFPVSNNPDLVARGLRHRAAVGLSEETDALVIVVSEETGTVSVAHNGKLVTYPPDARQASLTRWVSKAMLGRGRRTGFLAGWLQKRLQRRSGK